MIVVGAGAAGLGAATALAAHGPVTVLDRVPVPGGSVRYDHPDVRAAHAAACRAGVRFRLGATATRWDGGRLLVCAPGAIGWTPATRLVFAGGVRPATPAELGLTGDRPAGVLPVGVAKHLLEADPALWRRVAIVGDGPGAEEAAASIAAGGGTVTRVEAARAIVGRARVTGLDTGRGVIDCDAVLLAGGARPVRNVEGAIAEDADGVTYVQDVRAATFAETVRAAAELAA
jgi:NADPH-dependent 2,4-dienoyl-CoA reductase/sulfur reductase-like enzyme